MLPAELLSAAVLAGALLATALLAGEVVLEGLGPLVLGQAFRPLAEIKRVPRDVICVMPLLSAL